MAQVANIDSNSTGLSFARESALKTVSAPTWRILEPNSYGDFGGQNVLIARNPINSGRQRKKGVITDLDSMADFETDLTYSRDELQELWSAALCADFRSKGEEVVTAVDIDAGNPDEYEVASNAGFLVNSLIVGSGFNNAPNNALNKVTAITAGTVEVATGLLVAEPSPPSGAKIVVVGHEGATADITIDASGVFPELRATTLNFTTLGLNVGEWIFLGGDATINKFATAANNGLKRIRSIAAGVIVLDKSDAVMVTDAGTGKAIQIFFGRFLRNEQGSSIIKKTYHLERTLGAPDDALPSQIQSEYVTGSMVNEVELQIDAADKVLVNWSFVGLDTELRDGATGVKSGTRPALISDDGFNTSSDFSRIRLAPVSSTDEAPSSQFVYAMDMSLTINNNISPNKAVSVLGGFSMTLGTLEIGASLNAYLSNISALVSIKNNDSVTLDAALVKANKGIVIDMPLGTLGDGRPDVEQDSSVMVPLEFQAADASAVFAGYNYSMSMSFFDYLPTAAG